MRNREERRFRANCCKAPGGAPVKQQLRRASTPNYLDIAPQHLLSVTGAERFHRRFLCGKSPGKMDRGNSAALTVGNLTVGEDAVEEAIAVPVDGRCDPRDIGSIETKANDGRH